MQILGLLGMYFNAVVVFVTSHSLLFTLALAILCYEKLSVFFESQQLQNCRNCWKNFVPQWWYPNSDPSVQETLYLSNHYGPTFYTIAAPPSRQVFFLDTKKWTFDRQEAYAPPVSPFPRSICFSFNFFHVSPKGQLISKANFEVFIWTKNQPKIFLYFCLCFYNGSNRRDNESVSC